MSLSKVKFLGAVIAIGFSLVGLPVYAQAATNQNTEEVSIVDNDKQASITCKNAQAKLADYLESIADVRDEQLLANRSVLAFVNNISLRLEHNEQAEDSPLSDDVTSLNDKITDQETAYIELQSMLRSAASSSCTSEEQVDELRLDVAEIRKKVDEINLLQIEFEAYVIDKVMINLEKTHQQLEPETEEGVNT